MHRDVPEMTDHAHAARHGSQKVGRGPGSSLKIIVMMDIIVIIEMSTVQIITIIGNKH